MPKKGNYTALQRLRPITTDFGDLADFAVEEGRAKQAKIAADEQAKKDITKKFGEDYATLTDVVTQTKSIDEAYARGINSARDSMGEIYKEIERTPSKANDVQTQMKLQNLRNYSKNLKLVSDRYTGYATKVSKGMMDGTLSNWNSDVLSDLDSIFSQANLDVKVDPESGLPIAVTAELDENGQPTGKLKELNLVEALDGRGLTNTVNTYDFQGAITLYGGKLGKREVKTASGFTHTEYQKFEDIEPDVRKLVSGFIGNETNPSDIAKSIWSDVMSEQPKKLEAADMKRIEDFYVESLKGFYDEKNKDTRDFSAGLAARKQKGKEEKEKGLGIQLRTDEEGVPTKKNLVGVSGDLKGPALQYTLPKDLIVGIKGQNRLITDLYLTDSGKIAYEETNYTKAGKLTEFETMQAEIAGGKATAADFEVSSSTEGGLTTDELNEIARDLGFADAGELKDELERVRDEKLPASKYNTKEKTSTNTKVDTSKYN